MKKIITLLASLANLLTLTSQTNPRFDWGSIEAGCMLGGHNMQTSGMGYDYNGNVATVYDENIAWTTNITVHKYNTGSFVTGIILYHDPSGYCSVINTRFDATGNLYVLGLGDLVDLNPSSLAADTFEVDGGTRFLAKYSPTGSFLYAKRLNANMIVKSFCIGNNQDIYTASTFTGSVNADINGGSSIKTSAGGLDILISHYNSTTNLVSAFKLGGSANDDVSGIDVDNTGKIFIAGTYTTSTNDFDPSGATFSLINAGGNDAYIAKYTGMGSMVWARKISSIGNETVGSIRINEKNQLGVIGKFNGSAVNFAITGSPKTLTAFNVGNPDIFYVVYDTSGILKKANHIGNNTGVNIAGYSVNSNYALFVCGSFQGNYDLDGSSGTAFIESNDTGNGTDMFFQKYDSTGAMSFVKNFYDITYPNNTTNSYAYQIAAVGETFLVDGNFEGYIETTPADGFGGVSSGCFIGGNDFIFKYCSGDIKSPLAISGSTSVCVGNVLTYSVPYTPDANTYSWNLPASLTGTSTTNSIQVTVNSLTSGSITLSLKNKCDTVTLNLLINTNCITGIKSSSDDVSGVNIYPNPSQGIFNVVSEKEIGNIIIINAVGQTIFKQYVSAKEYALDLNKNAAGVYFLQLENQHLKIVKE